MYNYIKLNLYIKYFMLIRVLNYFLYYFRYTNNLLGFLKIFFERANKVTYALNVIGNTYKNSKWTNFKTQNIKHLLLKDWVIVFFMLLFFTIVIYKLVIFSEIQYTHYIWDTAYVFEDLGRYKTVKDYAYANPIYSNNICF